jgi:hypothetical protein
MRVNAELLVVNMADHVRGDIFGIYNNVHNVHVQYNFLSIANIAFSVLNIILDWIKKIHRYVHTAAII